LEKYGRARKARGDSVIGHMNITCWITKATTTHPEYVILYYFSMAKMVT
jgi:hypothetical protein